MRLGVNGQSVDIQRWECGLGVRAVVLRERLVRELSVLSPKGSDLDNGRGCQQTLRREGCRIVNAGRCLSSIESGSVRKRLRAVA